MNRLTWLRQTARIKIMRTDCVIAIRTDRLTERKKLQMRYTLFRRHQKTVDILESYLLMNSNNRLDVSRFQ